MNKRLAFYTVLCKHGQIFIETIIILESIIHGAISITRNRMF